MNGGVSVLGKWLVALGLVVAAVGAAVWLLGRAGGRLLPGDIYVKRENLTILFPVASCAVLSLLATLLIWLLLRGRR